MGRLSRRRAGRHLRYRGRPGLIILNVAGMLLLYTGTFSLALSLFRGGDRRMLLAGISLAIAAAGYGLTVLAKVLHRRTASVTEDTASPGPPAPGP
jgi:hypothetical protein